MRPRPLDRARAIAPGQPVRWKQLELDAFREHPDVLRGLDPSIRARGARGRLTAVLLWSGVAAVVAPVVAMAILVPSRISAAAPVDYEAAIPVSSLLFLVADAALVPLAVGVLRQREGQRFFRGLGISSVVMAVLTVAISVGVSPSIDGVWLWMIPVLLGAAAGFALVVAPTRQVPALDDAQRDGPRTGPRAVARAAIAELDAADRQRAGEELRAAIDELARSGAISAREADWARGAQLGMLSIRMSQPRR